MIEKLTAEQEALFPVYVEKWTKIGLSTDRIDRDRVIASAKKAYRLAGLKEPTQFFVVDSPVAAIQFIQKLDKKLSKSDIVNSMIYGCHDAAWLSFYDYFRTVVKLEVCDKLEGLFELADNCGWMNMYEDVVVFQEKPVALRFDDQKRLHSEVGPAIEYADGFGVYSWHGVAIPKEWIMDKASLTAKTALTWANIEQRRAACEIVTWAKILKELKSVTIEKDEDPMIGELLEVDIPDIGKEKFLRVLCATGREFALPVPPTMKTALEANAWTFDIDTDKLMELEVRT